MAKHYVVGIDFGTDSVRTVVVNAKNGKELSSAAYTYPRWKKGRYCDPSKNQFRQHPKDYLEGLVRTVHDALNKAPTGTANHVSGISIDTTGSTPAPVTKDGTPLALLPEFSENPHAMFILWKDHTAVKEAEEINQLAHSWGGVDFTLYSGGVYSSEWFWSKILHLIRKDPRVAEAAFSWVEHCDWMPAELTGITDPLKIKRSRCAAGHKALWHPSWGGLPSEEFLERLDPRLRDLRKRLYTETSTSDVPAGTLSAKWAKKLGLSTEVVVGVGALDAHMGAVGGEISPYSMIKVMGTSTCDMLVAPLTKATSRRGTEKLIRGICGQVDGSIVPGMLGLEAGQSAFGDVYAWFRDILAMPLGILANSRLADKETKEKLIQETMEKIIPELSKAAEKVDPTESGLLAVDWLNGRRTPDADQTLCGAIFGLNLGSDAPRIFRALVEATAFGSKAIVDRFQREGVDIRDVIAVGGVAKKSPFVVQIVSDVLNLPIKVSRSEQTVALGASMFAAVAAGIYNSIPEAQQAMGAGIEKTYVPKPERVKVYEELYQKYLKAGEFLEKILS